MSAALEYPIPEQPLIAGETLPGFGTTIGVWSTSPAMLPSLVAYMTDWVEMVEAACSRFRPNSDLSRANAQAGTAVRVSRVLLSAVDAACGMAAATDGLYDPTVGASVISAGYDRTFDLVTSEGPGRAFDHRAGGAWWLVRVDHSACTITVPEGYRLDLGGSAKGWAVDIALGELKRTILPQFANAGICISAGGDLAVCGNPPSGGWPVSIRESLDGAGASGRDVRIAWGAMATSGAGVRRWARDGIIGHHIVDPRTGGPATSNWSLVTTFSDSCLVADTMATAAWLLQESAPAQLSRWGIGARLVDNSGTEVLVGDLGRWVVGELR